MAGCRNSGVRGVGLLCVTGVSRPYQVVFFYIPVLWLCVMAGKELTLEDVMATFSEKLVQGSFTGVRQEIGAVLTEC